MKRAFRYYLPPLVWMGLIFFFSAQPDLPSAPSPWLDTLLKKIGHALAYGVLAWLYLRPLVARRLLRERFRHPTVPHVISFSLVVLYALSDEYHQTLVPGRNGTLWDVGVDSLGALVAMLLARWLRHRPMADRQKPDAQ